MKYLPGCLEITISFLFKPVKKLQNYEKISLLTNNMKNMRNTSSRQINHGDAGTSEPHVFVADGYDSVDSRKIIADILA